jgi:hypothetical protein
MRKFIRIRWQDSIEIVDAQLGQNPRDNETKQVPGYYQAQDRTVLPKTTLQQLELSQSGMEG